ncbi:MAG TPA: hypothetical protein VN316_01140 [candidate division Zixibacteria bacterium]|nr:hypothetical protein [candidate division Zixibacteria bacterium]
MKTAVEDSLKRVLTDQKLSKESKALLTSEVAEALELFYAIARYLPEVYHEDLTPLNWPSVYPKVMKVFNQNSKERECSHDLVSLGPIVVDRDIISNKHIHSILKQCRRCKEVMLEPAEF